MGEEMEASKIEVMDGTSSEESDFEPQSSKQITVMDGSSSEEDMDAGMKGDEEAESEVGSDATAAQSEKPIEVMSGSDTDD